MSISMQYYNNDPLMSSCCCMNKRQDTYPYIYFPNCKIYITIVHTFNSYIFVLEIQLKKSPLSKGRGLFNYKY